MIALATFCAFLALFFLAVEVSNLTEFTRLRPGRSADVRVDVYVAMRDEARNADAFLQALLRDEAVSRAIVVDDGSEDETLELLRAHAARDARVVALCAPGDTAGKGAALGWATRAHPPEAPFVLFTDADVRVEPGCIGALVALAREREVASVSAWPRATVASAAAFVAAPAVTLFLLQMLPMRLARGSDPRFSAGNGQLFLVESRAYTRSGGHAASDAVVEDVALARTLKNAGARVALASAAGVASVATYASLADAFRGFGRSLYFGGGVPACVVVLLWQVAVYLAPLALLPFAPVSAGIAVVAALAARIIAAVRMRETALQVVLFPLSALVTTAIATYAGIAGPAGALRWRGRELQKRNAGR